MHPELAIMPEGEEDHADSALSFAISRPSSMGHRTQSGMPLTSGRRDFEDDPPEPNLSLLATEGGLCEAFPSAQIQRHSTEPPARAVRSSSVRVPLRLVRVRRGLSSATPRHSWSGAAALTRMRSRVCVLRTSTTPQPDASPLSMADGVDDGPGAVRGDGSSLPRRAVAAAELDGCAWDAGLRGARTAHRTRCRSEANLFCCTGSPSPTPRRSLPRGHSVRAQAQWFSWEGRRVAGGGFHLFEAHRLFYDSA